MSVKLVSGLAAYALFDCPNFLEKWKLLYSSCSWATPFQSTVFIKTWLLHYQSEYEPVIVLAESDSRLEHLLLLAQHKVSKKIVHAGAHQAEYQCWLSLDEKFERFIVPAMEHLKAINSQGQFELKFLPPLLSRLIEASTVLNRVQCISRQEIQPLVNFDVTPSPWASLKKKSNKSKLARLRKLGKVEVSLVKYDGDSIIETQQCLDQITIAYDMRQGAVNGCLPFVEDKNKRDFTQQLLAQDDNVQVLQLTLNDRIIASILGVINHNQFSVAVFSYDPLVAKHSPGKLLILMGSELLASRGLSAIDLTPGGSWKSRYANADNQVSVITLYTEPLTYFKSLIKESVIHGVKSGLAMCQIEPRTIREKLAGFAQTSKRVNSLNKAGHKAYYIEVGNFLTPAQPPGLRKNKLSDFIDLSKTFDSEKQRDFLGECLIKFESGQTGYSVKVNGVVLWCGWLTVTKNSEGETPRQCLIANIYGTGGKDVTFLRSLILTMGHDALQPEASDGEIVLCVNESLITRDIIDDLGLRAHTESALSYT